MVARDPEGREIEVLGRLAGLDAADVLEVGCGSGRLTWRLAARAASVLATDPDTQAVAQARAACPPDLAGRVSFEVADSTCDTLPRARFDRAVLSWSL